MKLLAALLFIAWGSYAQTPSDAEIHQILAERVGVANRGIAIVVGMIDAHGQRVISYGSLAKDDKRAVDGNTVFEIGSMTKVFTSLILMDMVAHHEVALDDPVQKFLPASVKIPQRNGKQITLADLSTQSSGLPRMPSNFNPKDSSNPYADYTVRQMYDFLSGYQLTRDIGSQYEYSNLGVGLLGHVLALRAGADYETLVRQRICTELGMTDTRITLTPAMTARLAEGHTEAGEPTANWDLPTFAGAGALRSTTNDILTFLAANLGFRQTPLAANMAAELAIRKPTGMPNLEVAYAWHILTKNGNTIVWHNGGTGGYRTFMGFDPKAKVGVVVLSNISTSVGTDDIGRHLLDASYPLQNIAPPKEHTEISMSGAAFEKFVGNYQLAPAVVLSFMRDGDKFMTQITGQGKIQIYPDGPMTFFLKAVDAQLKFDIDVNGNATQVTLHQNGRDQIAKRMTDDEIRQARDEQAAVAQRYKDQKPTIGAEAALRNHIEKLTKGTPDYDAMGAQLAAATKQQLLGIQGLIAQWGALQSITFTGVGPGGNDIYDVRFEHATTEWRIGLTNDGKVQSLTFRPK
jgi:CubicO group peptidase (beta-lactamase class C family)